MALKTADWTVPEEGRDKGKVFRLTEMPAYRAEDWATRAIRAANRAGVKVDPSMAAYGMQAVAAIGIEGLVMMDPEESRPLMREMLGCARLVPNPQQAPDFTRDILESDIEEPQTITALKIAIVRLHINFSSAGASQNSLKTSASTTPAISSPNTPTVPPPSGQSFRGRSPRSRSFKQP